MKSRLALFVLLVACMPAIAAEGSDPLASRSAEDIKKVVTEIISAPMPEGADVEREVALRRLKTYRYLAGVPYENLVLDDQLNKEAQAAAAICEKLGRLDHAPTNPGLPDADYKLAKRGAAKSNLSMMKVQPSLTRAMDLWMWDSDADNIDHLGHRRWCINPAMQKVGFGRTGNYAAIWAHDTSQRKVPDYDFVSWPPRGAMPVGMLSSTAAWSVSLNPKKFKAPGKGVKYEVFEVDEKLAKTGEPLTLSPAKVDSVAYGLPHCFIFRPEKVAIADGKRYLVEIKGLVRSTGKPAPTLSYTVEFVTIR